MLLLSHGHLVYGGPTHGMLPWLSAGLPRALGQPADAAPFSFAPERQDGTLADWAIDLVSLSDAQVLAGPRGAAAHPAGDPHSGDQSSAPPPQPGGHTWVAQAAAAFQREHSGPTHSEGAGGGAAGDGQPVEEEHKEGPWRAQRPQGWWPSTWAALKVSPSGLHAPPSSQALN